MLLFYKKKTNIGVLIEVVVVIFVSSFNEGHPTKAFNLLSYSIFELSPSVKLILCNV